MLPRWPSLARIRIPIRFPGTPMMLLHYLTRNLGSRRKRRMTPRRRCLSFLLNKIKRRFSSMKTRRKPKRSSPSPSPSANLQHCKRS